MRCAPPRLDAYSVESKWYNSNRGFGFIVSVQCEGDVLFHFKSLREHAKAGLPVGAIVECLVEQHDRGLQICEIISIDPSESLISHTLPARPPLDRDERQTLTYGAGSFESVEVRWFNRIRGFGFLNRRSDPGTDIFIHRETVRLAELSDLQPDVWLEARVADGRRGLTAVELKVVTCPARS